jgi:hypothetical protein
VAGAIALRTDASATGTHLDHFWSRVVGAGRANGGLRADWVDEGPFPGVEIHLTERNSSSSPRDHTHDTLPAATFVVRSVLHSLGTVDSLAYWTFTDVFEEGGAGAEMFHGGFGMMTLQGAPKPTFQGARFAVERLGAGYGNALAAWAALGSPAEPTREETALVERGVGTAPAEAAGALRLMATLSPWAVVLVREVS